MTRPRIYCTEDLKRLPSQAEVDRRNNRRAVIVCLLVWALMAVAGYIEHGGGA